MSDKTHHEEHANRNIEFLSSFYQTYKFNDWSITVAFYSALHVMETAIFLEPKICYKGNQIQLKHSEDLEKAIRSAKLQIPKNTPMLVGHQTRQIIIEENFVGVRVDYYLLYNQCRMARYYRYAWTDQETNNRIASLRNIISWANKKYFLDLKLPTRISR